MLRRRLLAATLALLITVSAVTMAAFAWYIYQVSAHTTKVQMAAGTGVSLLISNTYDGSYNYSTPMREFTGVLTPVSTHSILNGSFHRMTEHDFEEGEFKATAFGESIPNKDYYMTSLYLKSAGGPMDVYLSDIGFEDSSEKAPISTAIRVGLVMHEPGKDAAAQREMIYSISNEKNPNLQYNTIIGKEGDVIASVNSDGSPNMVTLEPLTDENYCAYDKLTGVVSLKPDSRMICRVTPDEAVQVDVYIWLEGCDEDCTGSLAAQTLKNLALSFAGYGGNA